MDSRVGTYQSQPAADHVLACQLDDAPRQRVAPPGLQRLPLQLGPVPGLAVAPLRRCSAFVKRRLDDRGLEKSAQGGLDAGS